MIRLFYLFKTSLFFQATDVRRDINKALGKLKKSRSKGERASLSKELRELRKELFEREKAAVKQILKVKVSSCHS